MKTRIDGFYWVNHKAYGIVVAEWVEGSGWNLPGVLYSVPDKDMVFISPKRLTFRRT